MPITIAYPPSGTAGNPTRLPKKFVAFGGKDDDQVPVGVMMSCDAATHKPDGKIVVGGTLITKKKKLKTGAVDSPQRWAMHFKLTHAKPNQHFALFVFDAHAFPCEGAVGDFMIKLVRKNFLAAKRRNNFNVKGGKPDKDGIILVPYINPPSNSNMPADQFVAYGDLPPGDYDIHPTNTKVTTPASGGPTTDICTPDFSWSDGESFFVAFFPVINKATNPKVDVTVAFESSGEDDTSVDIMLD